MRERASRLVLTGSNLVGFVPSADGAVRPNTPNRTAQTVHSGSRWFAVGTVPETDGCGMRTASEETAPAPPQWHASGAFLAPSQGLSG